MRLLEPLPLGASTATNRLVFGPHVTNLAADDRSLPGRWVSYHAARAAGGAGLVVAEGASVHDSDWPYERAPLAARCADGWAELARRCHDAGSLLIAGLDHAGGQGSSAYSQRELWAPSRVPEVNSREVPKWMEDDDVEAVIAGFAAAAALAREAGCDGVEVNAGQHSLIRQFVSGLTNQRGDEWGTDRTLLARRVITDVRSRVGANGVVGLRLSCDELAPWAGITPEMAPAIAVELAGCGLDYLVVTRGSIFSIEKTRPDFHEPTGFNIDVCRAVRDAVTAAGLVTKVILQGSIVDTGQAEWAVGDGVCDAVEMTRAQIADPQLVAKLSAGTPERIRPCIRCNQTCQVRDARNPIVTCVGEPSSGRETEDPDWYVPTRSPREVVVVGGGPAGLEAARVAATRGHRVRVVEQAASLGGVAAVAGPGAPLVEWLIAECATAGVVLETGSRYDGSADLAPGTIVIQATGGRSGDRPYAVDPDADAVVDIAELRAGAASLPAAGPVVIFDPIGGPIGIAIAAELGDRAVLVTQDNIAGNELSRTGDLAPANVRLAQAGVRIERRSLLRVAGAGHVTIEDKYTAEQRDIECVAMVDCGFRLPTEPIAGAA
ncbi:MAG: NADH:flavin oxidoreductase/NADH oxidase, partial [Ilumatobacteraceae bacterium]|nr:NADH:flavin oxidoreductase/NADH oxidase [Ilumatobacteraceae bacterium]